MQRAKEYFGLICMAIAWVLLFIVFGIGFELNLGDLDKICLILFTFGVMLMGMGVGWMIRDEDKKEVRNGRLQHRR